MEEDSIWGHLFLQLLLIFVNGVFASAEIAVISMNDNKMEKMASEGDKRALRLSKLTEQPSQFLSIIQVAITLAGSFGNAFAADNFAGRLSGLLVRLNLGIPASTYSFTKKLEAYCKAHWRLP